MDQCLVSILMPIRNGKVEHFDDALESLVKQTYDNIEILILDNGASNEIKERIAVARKYEHRIKVVDASKSKNLAEVLNQGILRATGKIILRQDADDVSFLQGLKRRYI